MLQQVKSGKILCLCSKNVQEDVDRVFSERPDMILKEKDIVSSKINWQPKSQNIKQAVRRAEPGT
jgi:predicted enzyme involved in methoxymalonyl-ACP biosynthesis